MEDYWSSNAEEALVAALKTSNVVLKSLKIGNQDSNEGEIGGPIEYYLKLNKLNRKHFVRRYEQVTVAEWISVLAKAGIAGTAANPAALLARKFRRVDRLFRDISCFPQKDAVFVATSFAVNSGCCNHPQTIGQLRQDCNLQCLTP